MFKNLLKRSYNLLGGKHTCLLGAMKEKGLIEKSIS